LAGFEVSADGRFSGVHRGDLKCVNHVSAGLDCPPVMKLVIRGRNPTLNERIDWTWFVGSQIAFGLACGWVVSRSTKIETMQNWPLTERAGIEAQTGSEEKPGL